MHRLLIIGLVLLTAAAGCSTDPEVAKRRYVKSGDEYMRAGKFPEAAIEYANAVRTDTMFGEARFKLAEARLASGDKRGAFPEFVRAADLLTDDVEAQLRAGHLLLTGGFFEEARNRARTVLKKDPRNTTALVMLGNSLAGLKNLDDAITVMERAIQVDPERAGTHANLGVLELAKGDRAAAEAAFKQAVDVSRGAPDARHALANFYLAVQRWREAEDVLNAAVREYPRHLNLNRALASLYVQTRRLKEAEQMFKTIAEMQKDAASRIALAAFYQWAGRDADAVAVLTSLAGEPAHFVRAKSELALLHFAQNRKPEADRAIDEVLAREPRNAKAITTKARLLLAENRPTEALIRVNEAVQIDPKSAEAQLTLGRVHEKLRNFKDAARAYNEVIALNPDAVPARLELSLLHLQNREIDTAIQLTEQAVKLSHDSLPARLGLVRALTARPEDHQRAKKELQSLLGSHARVPAVHLAVAALALSEDDSAKARRAFELALQLDPGSNEAVAGLLALDIAQHRIADAQRRAESLATARPDDSVALLLVANAYGFTGDTAKTEAALRQALRVDPSNPSISSLLGTLYMRQNRVDEAIAGFEEVARLEPKAVGAATLLGLLYYSKHDRDNAQKWWSRALQIEPHAAAAANNLAWLYTETGEHLDEALRLALTARTVYPNVPEVLDTVGWVYYHQKLSRLAIGYFEQSIQFAPKNPLYHYHLGKAYADRGEDAKARKALQESLALDANFSDAEDARKVIDTLVF